MDIVQINGQDFLQVSDEDRRLVSKFMDGIYSVLIGWNDLIPVVQKIQDSYQGEELHEESCRLYDNIEAMLKELNIKWVWQAVMKFIIWYNETKLITQAK